MKNMLFGLILTFSLFVPTSSLLVAQEPEQNAPEYVILPDNVIDKFKDVLTNIETSIDKLTDPKFYEKWYAYDQVTEKMITFDDLSPEQKQGFFVYRAEALHNEIINRQEAWLIVIDILRKTQFDEDDPKKDEKKSEYKKLANQIESLAENELIELHKKLAAKREIEIQKFMLIIKDNELLSKELLRYFKDVKKSHDTLNLIDRKEDE